MGQNGSDNHEWVMGHYFDGSHGSWATLYDPIAALVGTNQPAIQLGV